MPKGFSRVVLLGSGIRLRDPRGFYREYIKAIFGKSLMGTTSGDFFKGPGYFRSGLGFCSEVPR